MCLIYHFLLKDFLCLFLSSLRTTIIHILALFTVIHVSYFICVQLFAFQCFSLDIFYSLSLSSLILSSDGLHLLLHSSNEFLIVFIEYFTSRVSNDSILQISVLGNILHSIIYFLEHSMLGEAISLGL